MKWAILGREIFDAEQSHVCVVVNQVDGQIAVARHNKEVEGLERKLTEANTKIAAMLAALEPGGAGCECLSARRDGCSCGKYNNSSHDGLLDFIRLRYRLYAHDELKAIAGATP